MEQQYDILSRINEHYNKMSKSHKAVAGFISDHYDQAVFMTAAKLGETLGISESTVAVSYTHLDVYKRQAQYAALQTSVASAAKRGYVDQVVDAAETRKYVIGAFEMLFTKREDRPAKKHGTV